MTDYSPKPEDKFTFGLWTVGNIGRDPFGQPTRETLSPVQLVHLLAEVGAYGVNLHDSDLVPIDASPSEKDKIIAEFKRALAETGLVVPWRPQICSAIQPLRMGPLLQTIQRCARMPFRRR